MGAENSKNTHWQRDSDSPSCHNCGTFFSMSLRRHHCRNCGLIFCNNCSNYRSTISKRGVHEPVRVCANCLDALRKSIDNVSVSGVVKHCDRSFYSEFYDNNMTGEGKHNAFMGLSSIMGNNAVNKDGVFWGSSVLENGKSDRMADTMAFDDPYTRFIDNTASTHVMSGNTADQSEKECLVNIWLGIRQRAVFTDILLQQIERVEENTDVVYCREVENMRLQPEGPELLGTMFPFPRGTEGNMELLLEAFDPHLAALHEENQNVDNALKLLSMRLLGTTCCVDPVT